VVASAGAAVIAGGAWAAIAASSDSTNSVNACILPARTVIVAATAKGHCPEGATRVTINKRGPRGPSGPPGAPGLPGEPPAVIDGGAP